MLAGQQQSALPPPLPHRQPGLTHEAPLQGAHIHRQLMGPLRQWPRLVRLGTQRPAQPLQRRGARLRQRECQTRHPLDFVQQQLHQMAVAPLGVIVIGQRDGRQDQLAQQRRDADHAALGGQTGQQLAADIDGAHQHLAEHDAAVPDSDRHPDRPRRRHDPLAGVGLHQHHPLHRIEQLGGGMAVARRLLARLAIEGAGHQRRAADILLMGHVGQTHLLSFSRR